MSVGTVVGSQQPSDCSTQQGADEINIDETLPPETTNYYAYDIDDSSVTVEYDTNVRVWIRIFNYEKYETGREIKFDSALEQHGFVYETTGGGFEEESYTYDGDLAFSSQSDTVEDIGNDDILKVVDDNDWNEEVIVANPSIIIRPGSGTFTLFGLPNAKACLSIESLSEAAAGDIILEQGVETSTPTPTTTTATPTPTLTTTTPTPTPTTTTPTPTPTTTTVWDTDTSAPETESEKTEVDSDGDGVPDDEDYAPSDPSVQEKSDLRQTTSSGDVPGFTLFGSIVAVLTFVVVTVRYRGGDGSGGS